MLSYLNNEKLSVEALMDPDKRQFALSQIWVLHNVVRMTDRTTTPHPFMACHPHAVDALYKFCYATEYPVIFLTFHQ